MRPHTRYLIAAAIIVVLAVSVWFGSTRLLLSHWTHRLATSASSHESPGLLSSGDRTRFILWMNEASPPYLRHAIDSPDARLRGQIHCAWILSRLGDHSRFHVFFDGLRSGDPSVRYIAAVRMWDFPDECFEHVHSLVTAAGTEQHDVFWANLAFRAEQLPLTATARLELRRLLDDGARSTPLSNEEQARVEELLNKAARPNQSGS